MTPNPAIALLMVLGLASCQDRERNAMPQTSGPLAGAPQELEPQQTMPQEIPPPSQTNPSSAPPQ